MVSTIKKYIHPQLNEEITAIAGHYIFTKECVLPYQDKTILYYVGYAIFDTTCCGTGGCFYSFVPGFIIKWKFEKNIKGQNLSEIEPIIDPIVKDKTTYLIKQKESVNQIQFL